LLSNAVKYSPNGDAIDVEAVIVLGEIVVVIADHGIGIPDADLRHLFERYYRGSNVSGIVGTGVGLYLVKMAVDMHGGRINVESKEGEGTRFILRLPIRREVVEDSPPLAADTATMEDMSQ
jgi:signal transduction histidine kinase